MPRGLRVLMGLLAGLGLGIAASVWPSGPAPRLVEVLEPLGMLWINAVRMTVLPLVVSLLVIGLASSDDGTFLASIGGRTLFVFVALGCLAAGFAVVVTPRLFFGLRLADAASASLRAGVSSGARVTGEELKQLPTLSQWLTGLIPPNVVRAAADGAMLPVIIFTVVFGLAVREIQPLSRDALIDAFRAFADAMMALVRWLIGLAPIGVFALIAASAARIGLAVAGALGYYVVAICAEHVLFVLLLYCVAWLVARVSLPRFGRAVLAAQAVALSSSSSLASLPALVGGARDELRLRPAIVGFVLPLAVAAFKICTPITFAGATLFLSQLYGVHLGLAKLATVSLAGVLIGFTIPGVPQGGILVLGPLLANIGLPAEGVGLLIAADTVPDLFATLANVTGDMTSAVLLQRFGARVDRFGRSRRPAKGRRLGGP